MQNYKKKMYFCIFKQYFNKKDFSKMKIHPDTLAFFDELHANNNRDWFAENKPRWTEIQRVFLDFTQQLINIMTPLDPGLGNLQPKQCVYRIYRDLRFSPDKRPYKTHIACFLPAGGNRTQCVPGYYQRNYNVIPLYKFGDHVLSLRVKYSPEEFALQNAIHTAFNIFGKDPTDPDADWSTLTQGILVSFQERRAEDGEAEKAWPAAAL